MATPPDGNDCDTVAVEIPASLTPPPPKHRHHEQLLVLMGEGAGDSFAIGDGVTIGRGDGCDVTIGEGSISRHHARMTRRKDDGLLIEDLSSRNGTFVNGVAVRSRSQPLAIGDRIQLGAKVVLLLTHEDPLKSILRERQKMELIGRLAAGVAHDFNNVAFAALSTCDHVVARLQTLGVTDADVREALVDLRAALERGADLTRGLATLGRKKSTTVPEPIDIASVCEETARLCERTFGPRIHLTRRLRRGLFVRAHRTELHQIILNLCLNARDAMPDGGQLCITAARASGAVAPPAAGLDWVQVEVRDTGVGMSDDVRVRIFEPFFTTKREGHGTGLGLATAFDLVRSMRGHIDVETAPGSGTTFRVLIPGEALGPSGEWVGEASVAPALRAPPRSVRILLVEDEELVRRSMTRLLIASGHLVTVAESGEDALRLFQLAAPRPEVVLLDLDMPGMGGEETLRQLLAVDPAARVLVLSGHWDPDRAEAVQRAGALGYLAKPCEASALRAAIQRLSPAG